MALDFQAGSALLYRKVSNDLENKVGQLRGGTRAANILCVSVYDPADQAVERTLSPGFPPMAVVDNHQAHFRAYLWSYSRIGFLFDPVLIVDWTRLRRERILTPEAQ